jgi:hypothetical protein
VKRGQLIHAVEHDRARRHVAREIKCHRRVEPQDRPIDRELDLHFDKQSAHFLRHCCVSKIARKMGFANVHALIARDAKLGCGRVENRFFEEKDAALFREPRHQMLRALEHKVPT